MTRTLIILGALLAVLAAAPAAVATHAAGTSATVSPVGLWHGENGYTYRWTTLAGGGYAEYMMTPHKTSESHCSVKANTLEYRYHALGNGIYNTDSLNWHTNCTTYWVIGDERIKLTATAKQMALSCDQDYGEVCFSYTRK